jgi:predicted RNA binding protein YcfA (HicA-like mRNA interferase family)
VSALEKKGFVLRRSSDHEFYELQVNGKKSGIRTKVSHGSKDIPPLILSKMAKQIKVTNQQFNNLIDCPFSYHDLLMALQAKNYL